MTLIHGDCLEEMKKLKSESAQIIICDPPYNIGKDFGNNKCKMKSSEYIKWCKKWIEDCLHILKKNGTMFIYGVSETLAEILNIIPKNINKKWLVWHYTNKTIPKLSFWQPSHESILVLWKDEKVFNTDLVRVNYTDSYLKADGKKRTSTIGRFSDGTKETLYKVNPFGALPRDVIKISSLAGSNKERVNHPTQKPLSLCETLINSCKQQDGYVLVPFAGSGSECVASKKLGLDFIGIEKNIEYIVIIKDRLGSISQNEDNLSSFHCSNWSNLQTFSDKVLKKTQYQYYLENNSSPEVLSLVELNSKIFGTVCEKMIIEMLKLEPRNSSQNDAMYKNYKIEIKVGRYLKYSDECMWQHIEPNHDYDILLCCLLTFAGFDIYYISKKQVISLIEKNIIKKQGKQGYICHKSQIKDYLHKIQRDISEIDDII